MRRRLPLNAIAAGSFLLAGPRNSAILRLWKMTTTTHPSEDPSPIAPQAATIRSDASLFLYCRHRIQRIERTGGPYTKPAAEYAEGRKARPGRRPARPGWLGQPRAELYSLSDVRCRVLRSHHQPCRASKSGRVLYFHQPGNFGQRLQATGPHRTRRLGIAARRAAGNSGYYFSYQPADRARPRSIGATYDRRLRAKQRRGWQRHACN